MDFHYSDNWADPGKQIKPAAWKDYDFEQLKKAVYDHTFDVCSSLVAQGTPPDMVQVGNEINAGMLWPDGDYEHMDNLAALLKEGYQAVKDCSSSTPVMLHIAEGGDNDLARWWFDNMAQREVPFDVIGISYYPYWHGSLGQLQSNLNDISARYDKDVIVVETAYAFTDQEDDFHPNICQKRYGDPGLPVNTRRSACHAEGCNVNCAGCAQRARARHFLLGRHLDGGCWKWMGLYRPRLRECMGKSGLVRLRRPCITGDGRIPESIGGFIDRVKSHCAGQC